MNSKKDRLEKTRQALLKIDEQLDIIEASEPYGDMIENFQDIDREERVTDRLVRMIDKDLAKS